MMRKPNNWEAVQEFSERRELPLGAYVCKIKQAEVRTVGQGEQLCVAFDIAEGEQQGFYALEFKANTRQDKKWKGVLRVWLPRDDGSDRDEVSKSVLKGFVTSVEKSNPGFRWNWEEQSLAGRAVGILMRNEEWEVNGRSGWSVRPFRAMSVDSVRSGEYKLPDDKPLATRAAYLEPPPPAYSGYGYGDTDDYRAPF